MPVLYSGARGLSRGREQRHALALGQIPETAALGEIAPRFASLCANRYDASSFPRQGGSQTPRSTPTTLRCPALTYPALPNSRNSAVPSDIEIARAAKLQPISAIAERAGIPES